MWGAVHVTGGISFQEKRCFILKKPTRKGRWRLGKDATHSEDDGFGMKIATLFLED